MPNRYPDPRQGGCRPPNCRIRSSIPILQRSPSPLVLYTGGDVTGTAHIVGFAAAGTGIGLISGRTLVGPTHGGLIGTGRIGLPVIIPGGIAGGTDTGGNAGNGNYDPGYCCGMF